MAEAQARNEGTKELRAGVWLLFSGALFQVGKPSGENRSQSLGAGFNMDLWNPRLLLNIFLGIPESKTKLASAALVLVCRKA